MREPLSSARTASSHTWFVTRSAEIPALPSKAHRCGRAYCGEGVSTPYPLGSPFPLLAAHCTTHDYAHCIRSTPYSKEWRWKMPFNLAAPLCRLGKTAAVEIQALNCIFAPARSRQPTDSPPAAGLPDDSDSSRCLARALAPQVCDTHLLRADVTRLDSLGDLPPLEDRDPLKSSGPPASQDPFHTQIALRKV